MTEPLSQHTRNSAPAGIAPPTADLHRGDPLPDPDAGDDTRREPDRETPPGAPRWVKALGITAFVLVLLLAGLHLTGNVPTHMPGSSATEHGLRQAP